MSSQQIQLVSKPPKTDKRQNLVRRAKLQVRGPEGAKVIVAEMFASRAG